ncbi:DNA-3-methyladenine glycosylase [Cellulomonas sp. APG4]|uniref:DNA-3-methyladenine glycosylase n=1 Tax=Cellulomonas sp. APG4 TaxID=1538656 RepID=UPI00137B0330|nr:DNA-3-methyladenine glycosylase [Cellulomonas sp. APG4]
MSDLHEVLARPVLEVAPLLLGAYLTSSSPEGDVTVRLTEVEAYDGECDPGSHAFRGPSRRNQVMFGPAGNLYVYRHMGLHTCANVVTGRSGLASAVLLRAGEVVDGVALAHERRTRAGVARSEVDLARGPARLAVALGIALDDLGTDVVDGERLRLRLAPPAPDGPRIRTGPRVGVSGEGGDAVAFPWRFWLDGEPTVSVFRPGPSAPRARRGTDVGRSGGAGTAH